MQFKLTLALTLSALVSAHKLHTETHSREHAVNAIHEGNAALTDAALATQRGVHNNVVDPAARVVNAAGGAALQAKDAAVDTAYNVKEGAVQTAYDVKEGAARKAHNAKEGVRNTAQNVQEGTVNAFHSFEARAEEGKEHLKNNVANAVEYVEESTPVQGAAAAGNGAWSKVTGATAGALGWFSRKTGEAAQKAEESSQYRGELYEHNVQNLHARTEPIVEEAKEKSATLRERAASTFQGAKETVRGTAQSVSSRISGAVPSVAPVTADQNPVYVNGPTEYRFLNKTQVPLEETNVSRAEIAANPNVSSEGSPIGPNSSATAISIAAAAVVVSLQLLI